MKRSRGDWLLMRRNLRISNLLLESKESRRLRQSLRLGLTCHGFRMRHIYLHGQKSCPGNNESAGKKKSGKTRRGNNYLKATLTEAAWAASRTKDTAFSAMYRNIAGRRGKKRALVAARASDIDRGLSRVEDWRTLS